MLDMAFGLTDTSRLGCQVKLTKDMDGITATLPSATRNMFVDGAHALPVHPRSLHSSPESRKEAHAPLIAADALLHPYIHAPRASSLLGHRARFCRAPEAVYIPARRLLNQYHPPLMLIVLAMRSARDPSFEIRLAAPCAGGPAQVGHGLSESE